MKDQFNNVKQRGVIAIVTLLGVTTFALAIIVTLTDLALEELKMANAGSVIDDTYYAAEAGLNHGLYEMIQDSSPATYNTSINGSSVEVTISAHPLNGYKRVVTSQSVDPKGNVRTVQVIADTSSFAGGFDYAVQGGSGGVYLDNNSNVIGDVYANGPILPASGGQAGTVQGNAWSATTVDGLGLIEKITVNGDAHSHNIRNQATILGDAYYFDSSSIDADVDVDGEPCNPTVHEDCFPGSSDPGPRSFPIKQSDIDNWKTTEFTAADELLPDPANCPNHKDDGSFYCVQTNEIIGQKHIKGNLYVGNGATLTLSGSFLWVDGDVILDNNGTVEVKEDALCILDGNNDGDIDDVATGDDIEVFNTAIVIADGKVDVNNNYNFTGCIKDSQIVSGIILLSTGDEGVNPVLDTHNPDVYAANNSNSIIFSAINGLLVVKNGGHLNAAAAHTLFLEPNSTVTFNPLLSSFVIGNGGGEEVGTSPGTWQEL